MYFQDESKPQLKEDLTQLGFTFYYILQRFYDIDSKLNKDGELQTLVILTLQQVLGQTES